LRSNNSANSVRRISIAWLAYDGESWQFISGNHRTAP
jgi:hypothetical protein